MAVQDLMVQNGWYLEGIPGASANPHFETLEGLGIGATNVETVDGVTNKKKRYSSQIMDYKEITLTRPFQSNEDDYALHIVAMACIRLGFKMNISAVKRHKQVNVFACLLRDFRILDVAFPNFNVEAEEKFIVTYMASIDDMFLTPLRFQVTNNVTLPSPTLNVPIN